MQRGTLGQGTLGRSCCSTNLWFCCSLSRFCAGRKILQSLKGTIDWIIGFGPCCCCLCCFWLSLLLLLFLCLFLLTPCLFLANMGWGGVGCWRSCYADDVTLLVGFGVGWDVNVHVTLMMLRCLWGLGVGWGGMLTFMLRWWCYAARGGWGGVGCSRSCYADDVTLLVGVRGGVGWDVNVHVTLMMLRCSWGLGWGGMFTFMLRWWCYAARGGWGGVGCQRSCYADDVTHIDVLFPWVCWLNLKFGFSLVPR